MKVLVTGGTSMLGAATAHALAARGDIVTLLQRSASGSLHREVRADINDAVALRQALEGHDAV
ncbi:MAG: NAD-dependent epimerase/dehydratase family protein, partial [Actinobacteria bacterium]|nr:NAD-dependent epimerase/dehydratase family protein [Actinomycetota bacterium]